MVWSELRNRTFSWMPSSSDSAQSTVRLVASVDFPDPEGPNTRLIFHLGMLLKSSELGILSFPSSFYALGMKYLLLPTCSWYVWLFCWLCITDWVTTHTESTACDILHTILYKTFFPVLVLCSQAKRARSQEQDHMMLLLYCPACVAALPCPKYRYRVSHSATTYVTSRTQLGFSSPAILSSDWASPPAC